MGERAGDRTAAAVAFQRAACMAGSRPFQPFGTPARETLIRAVVAIPLWSALGWYASGVAQRNPGTRAVVAIAAWRLLRNVYVSARAIVDLIVPVTVTGMLLSLRHNGPGPREQGEALRRYPVGMQRFHQRHQQDLDAGGHRRRPLRRHPAMVGRHA
jgi:hypothetical protein